MGESRSSWRDGAAATATLGLVVLLYTTPLILTVFLGIFRSSSYGSGVYTEGVSEREVVMWMPPAPPGPQDLGMVAEAGSTQDGDRVDPSPVEDSVASSPVEPAIATASTADVIAPAKRRPVMSMRMRRRIAARKNPPVERSKKAQRKHDKRKRKRARQAERKQCHELIDQIVEVSDTEWWFGRELVACYRTHLEQFDRIGGAFWKKGEDGKRLGIAVRVSATRRGEPGRRAGWKTGDVVMSVNGFRVRSVTGVGLAATQLLRNKVRVKRIRDGKQETLIMRVVSEEKLAQKRIELQAVASSAE